MSRLSGVSSRPAARAAAALCHSPIASSAHPSLRKTGRPGTRSDADCSSTLCHVAMKNVCGVFHSLKCVDAIARCLPFCVRRTASRDVHDGGGLVHAEVAKGKEALPRTLSMHEILVREVTDIYALLSPPQIDFRTSPGVEGPKAVLAQQLVVCKSRLCCAEIVMKAQQPRQQLPMQRMQLT